MPQVSHEISTRRPDPIRSPGASRSGPVPTGLTTGQNRLEPSVAHPLMEHGLRDCTGCNHATGSPSDRPSGCCRSSGRQSPVRRSRGRCRTRRIGRNHRSGWGSPANRSVPHIHCSGSSRRRGHGRGQAEGTPSPSTVVIEHAAFRVELGQKLRCGRSPPVGWVKRSCLRVFVVCGTCHVR